MIRASDRPDGGLPAPPNATVPRLRVGCAMWANRDWVGDYLPPGTRPGNELRPYARLCTAVEGNTTFYALPSEATVERWRDATPDDFRFVLKMPRTITHDRRLRDASGQLLEFWRRIQPLRDRLGPTSIQLPASFGPRDLDTLIHFLDRLPDDGSWAVEVRDPAFHAGGSHERELNDALYDRGVDRIIFDSRAVFDGPCITPEEQEAFRNKPRLPVRAVATARQPIVRFIGQTRLDANSAYWRPWVERIVAWLEAGLEPIVFLHTPDNRVAPELCRRFHEAVAAEMTGLEPLPTPSPLATEAPLFDPGVS